MNSVVTPYYYNRATDSFVYTNPGASLYSDFKQMVVTVSWTTPDFRTTEGNTIAQATMGTGSITLVETVSSVTTAASSRVVTQDDEDIDDYSITYTPGLRPDIVSLSLGNNKFKESLTPQPDVIKSDELVETRFDVITYSQDGSGAFFVRREEFASVACDCTLKAPSGSPETSGRRAAVWAGDEYASFHLLINPTVSQTAILPRSCVIPVAVITMMVARMQMIMPIQQIIRFINKMERGIFVSCPDCSPAAGCLRRA